VNLLLDTNVVSEWAKPVPDPRFVRWIGAIDSREAHLSVVTLAEIERGIERLPQGRRRDRLAAWLIDELLEVFGDRIVEIDRLIASAWARMMVRCESAGRPLNSMDAFLAATAVVQGHTLVTRNVADFAATGVPLLNPWTD
jgi:hypothetical protein